MLYEDVKECPLEELHTGVVFSTEQVATLLPVPVQVVNGDGKEDPGTGSPPCGYHDIHTAHFLQRQGFNIHIRFSRDITLTPDSGRIHGIPGMVV